MTSLQAQPFRDHTSLSFEIFIVVFTVLPFFALAYFYPVLPQQVPLFLKLNGEVATWTEKSVLSVFRVPLIALITQIVFLVMKYRTLQPALAPPELEGTKVYQRYLSLNANLWDWFRWTSACKMIAESLNVIFLVRLKFLDRPTFVVSAIAALIGVVGALLYLYRVLVARRELKERFSSIVAFKFGYKWSGILIICLIGYILLVLFPR